ncbi:hypothetical protein WA026_012452 [Henosepilachna vigintioctopunctata]|uniref:Uncharacterized protein n=1 Tax=Henosepilachna vigintioctopunctata TaxID=420089 RepID=A0AAW1UQB5_9CUCU
MVQITGKFEMVKSENFVSHLKAMGVPAALAEEVDKIAPRLEFVHNGDKIKVIVQLDEPVSIELVLNQEVEEVFGDFKVKTYQDEDPATPDAVKTFKRL